MGSEWPKATLKESGVELIDCLHKTPKAQTDGFPYIGIPQLKEGRIAFDAKPRLISEEDLSLWTVKAKPQKNDVILSRRCNPGETAYVSNETEFALGQNLVLLRSSGENLFPPFLRWVTRSPQWWWEIDKYLNVGAVFDSLRCGDVPSFEIPLPPLSEQKAIAHILGSLDDKIELNRKMNETLEGMAQALFKSWFVDFDPVIDNILVKNLREYYADDSSQEYPSPPPLPEGEEPSKAESISLLEGLGEGAESIFEGIPDEFRDRAETRLKALGERSSRCVASRKDGAGAPSLPDSSTLPNIGNLFPSAFRESEELGWIPEGWEQSKIGKEYKVVMGQSPKGETFNENGLGMLFYQGRAEFGWRFPKPRLYTTDPKRLATAGDSLMSVRAPVGDFNMALDDCCVGRGLCALRHKSGSSSFTYYQMSDFRKILDKFNGEGTVFGSINQKDLKNQNCLAPDRKIVGMFVSYTEIWDSKIYIGSNLISSLTKLRDTLLPKLISGELSATTEKRGRLMSDLIFLGAGASQEAGIPTAMSMSQQMIHDIGKQSEHHAKILYYISAGLIFGKSKAGVNPFDPQVNVEELFNAVQLLAERRSLEISPFVSSWDPQVENFDSPSADYNSLDKAVGKILEKRAKAAFKKTPIGTHKTQINQILERRNYGTRKLGDLIVDLLKSYSDAWANEFSRSYNTGREVTKEFESRLKKLGEGGGGRIYRTINNTMIRTLRNLVFVRDSSKIEYLSPILNCHGASSGLTICSLNYDNTVELLCKSQDIPCNSGIDGWSNQSSVQLSNTGINLLKLHGSIDWVRDPEKDGKGKTLKQDRLKVLSENEIYGDKRTPFLIFGGKNKLTTDGPFMDLLFAFRERLEVSDNIVIVGYSFQDDHVNNIIKKWVVASPNRKVTIINGPDGLQSRSEFEILLKKMESEYPHKVRVIAQKAGDGLRELYGPHPGEFSYQIPFPEAQNGNGDDIES